MTKTADLLTMVKFSTMAFILQGRIRAVYDGEQLPKQMDVETGDELFYDNIQKTTVGKVN